MSQGTVFALAAQSAQRWANLVESCCPGVTRTEWHTSPAEIAITAWLTPRDGELGDRSPEVVEIVASRETVDDYIYAPNSPNCARTPSLSSSSSFNTCKVRHRARLRIASALILNSGRSPVLVSGCKPIIPGGTGWNGLKC